MHEKFKYLNMKSLILFLLYIQVHSSNGDCGCRGEFRPCFTRMRDILWREGDEATCVEDAAIGSSTVLIYLTALKKYCSKVLEVESNIRTFEGRELHEVIITTRSQSNSTTETKRLKEVNKPTILIDAGQEGGTESVGLALFFIQTLVACQEYDEMIDKAKWVILPSVNPDGMEYGRFSRPYWTKNLRSFNDTSYGVDISRNFAYKWDDCIDTKNNGFALDYSGPSAESENETIFISNALRLYKTDLKAYMSIRRNGHALLYPSAFEDNPTACDECKNIVSEISTKVNRNLMVLQTFRNDSIFNINRKSRCGHSVDFAHDMGILAFEWRVFYNDDNNIMSKFQILPKGYEATLRNGYLYILKEMYNNVMNEKKSD